MFDLLLFTLFVTLHLDAMDANSFHKWVPKWLKNMLPFIPDAWWGNNWKVKYNDDGSLKWWVYVGGASFIDFWHLTKSVLLVGIFVHAAVMHGYPWWAGLLMWGVFGILHEHVFYRRWSKKQ